METFMNAWTTLRGMNFYLEITIAATAVLFWGRMSKMDNRIAVWLPVAVCFLGQLAYGLQHCQEAKTKFGLDDLVMALFWTLLQAGISFMVFSYADKYGIIDKFIKDRGLADTPPEGGKK